MNETIKFDRLYHACCRHQWFTEGTNRQYDKMFEANRRGASVKELAIMIWLCSDVQFVEDIERELEPLQR